MATIAESYRHSPARPAIGCVSWHEVISQLMVVLDASIVIVAVPSAQKALHISVANRQ